MPVKFRKYESLPLVTEISIKEIAKDFRNEEKLLHTHSKFYNGVNRSILNIRRKDKKLMARVKEYNESLCMLGD